MWPLNTVATKFLYFLGGILVVAAVTTTSGNRTAVNGAPIYLPGFTSTGVQSRTVKVPVWEPLLAWVRGTGSTVNRYSGACFPNPFKGLGFGSGTLVSLYY